MSPSAQRIAIAEACGWKRVPVSPDSTWGYAVNGKEWFYVHLPNYLNDLNAMREAERHAAADMMNADQWEAFGRLLEKAHPSALLKDPKGEIDYYDFATLMTEITAAQRAEAFLRAIGKWDDAL